MKKLKNILLLIGICLVGIYLFFLISTNVWEFDMIAKEYTIGYAFKYISHKALHLLLSISLIILQIITLNSNLHNKSNKIILLIVAVLNILTLLYFCFNLFVPFSIKVELSLLLSYFPLSYSVTDFAYLFGNILSLSGCVISLVDLKKEIL